jgi:Uncharacterised nucleotidyltransferase
VRDAQSALCVAVSIDVNLIWARLEGILDRSDDFEALRAHRLHLLGLQRWRALGRRLPSEAARLEKEAAIAALSATGLLQHAVEAYDGRMTIMKGIEVARLYPDDWLRPFRDLDLIVDDVDAAQSALIEAGFEEVGQPEIYEDIHHLRPLAFGVGPLVIELHREPKWPYAVGTPPSGDRLLRGSVPSSTGVHGLLTLSASDHAICLAAHAWAHEPLLRLGDLLDVSLVAAQSEAQELAERAREFGVDRIWASTIAAATAIFGAGRVTFPLRTWARSLAHGNRRSVLEGHAQKWLSPFAALPFPESLRAAGKQAAADLMPAEGEGWSSKARRVGAALRDARKPRAVHDAAIGDDASVGNAVLARIRSKSVDE